MKKILVLIICLCFLNISKVQHSSRSSRSLTNFDSSNNYKLLKKIENSIYYEASSHLLESLEKVKTNPYTKDNQYKRKQVAEKLANAKSKHLKYLDNTYRDKNKLNAYTLMSDSYRCYSLLSSTGIIDKDNAILKELKALSLNYKNKLKSVSSEKLNSIAVSEFHKENLNKVFYSSNLNLDPIKAKAGDFKTAFKAGENIKVIVFLNDVAHKITLTKPPKIKIYGGNSKRSLQQAKFNDNVAKLTYITFILNAECDQILDKDLKQIAISSALFSELPPRKTTCSFNLEIGDLKFKKELQLMK